MNQLITPRQACWFSVIAITGAIAWWAWATMVWRLPFHPSSSISSGIALFVSMYAWSATKPTTLHRLQLTIGFWNIAVLVAVILAAIFGPVGQPFPEFALQIILAAGVLLLLTVSGCGLYNIYQHVTAARRHA